MRENQRRAQSALFDVRPEELVKNIHNRFSLSGGPDLNQEGLRKKILAVRLKNYKPEQETPYHVILLILLLIGFCFYISFYFYSSSKPKNQILYCSNIYDENDLGDCEYCPNDAICKGGKITACYDGYILDNDKCIENKELVLLQQEMVREIEENLATQNGNKICTGEESDPLTINNLETILKEKFGKRKDFHQTFELLSKELKSSFSKVREIEVEFNFEKVEYILKTKKTTIGILCSMKLFYHEMKYTIWGFLLLLLLSVIFTIKFIQSRKLDVISLNLYKANLELLNKVSKIPVRELLNTDPVDLNGKEKDYVNNKLEIIRLKDEQVGLFQQNNEFFWTLI